MDVEKMEKMVEKDPLLIKELQPNQITYKMCVCAVLYSPYLIEHIPYNMITTELCRIVVKASPYMIGRIPLELITQDMCDDVIDYSPLLITDFPSEFVTENMLLKAALYDERFRRDVRVYCGEDAERIVKKNIKYIALIPDRYKTLNMCIDAINTDPKLLAWVPITLHKLLPWKRLLDTDMELFEYLTDELKTYEMSNTAVNYNSRLYEFVPDSLKTQEMTNFAVSKSHLNFRHVPDKFKTPTLCANLLKTNPEYTHLIPLNFMEPRMITESLFVYITGSLTDKVKARNASEKLVDTCINTPGFITLIPKNYMLSIAAEVFKKTNDLNLLIGSVWNGSDFNKLTKGITFVKLSDTVEKTEIETNIPDDCCFQELIKIWSKITNKMRFVQSVKIPDNSTVKIMEDIIVADTVILGASRNIGDWTLYRL